MTNDVEVRTKGKIVSLTHPTGAVATKNSGVWPRDQFTMRRILDGDIEEAKTEDAPKEDIPAAKGSKSQKE